MLLLRAVVLHAQAAPMKASACIIAPVMHSCELPAHHVFQQVRRQPGRNKLRGGMTMMQLSCAWPPDGRLHARMRYGRPWLTLQSSGSCRRRSWGKASRPPRAAVQHAVAVAREAAGAAGATGEGGAAVRFRCRARQPPAPSSRTPPLPLLHGDVRSWRPACMPLLLRKGRVQAARRHSWEE